MASSFSSSSSSSPVRLRHPSGLPLPTPLLLLLLLSSITLSFAQWTLIGDFEPGRGSDQQRQMALDEWQGKTSAIQMFFTSWDTQEMTWMWTSLATIYSQGHIPIISWEPWQYQGQSPSDIEIQVPQGNYNSYIDTWGGQLKTWLAGADGEWNTADDRRAYMRFAHEMNGNWYPWSASTGQSTPADYVKMWRFIKTRLDNMGIDKKHMQWIFSGICIDVGDFKIEDYYPGDDYVDWIGLGGMNFGYSEANMGWNAPSFLFNSMIDRIRAVSHNSKPFGITEYCSVTNGGGVSGKNQWLDDLFTVVEEKEVKMLVYFNLDKNEGASGSLKDWMIFGGVNGDETFDYEGRSFKAYSAYRENVAKSYIKGSDMSLTNRWITDGYFYGTADDAVPAASSSSAPAISKTPAASASKSKSPVPSTSRDPSSSSTPEALPAASSSSTPEVPAASSSSSKAPAASSSSSPEAPAASSSSSPDAPAASSSSSPDASPPASPVPQKTTKIYCDNTKLSNVTKIGSRTVLYVNKLDSSAPEGTKVLQAKVTRQQGGLLIKREATMDISDFHYLQFHLSSSSFGTLVKVTDVKGRVCQKWVKGTKYQWRKVKLPIAALVGKCDKTKIQGVFGVTIPTSGKITVDNIKYY